MVRKTANYSVWESVLFYIIWSCVSVESGVESMEMADRDVAAGDNRRRNM
jgi:hypothetical protein